MNQDVSNYIEKLPPWQVDVCEKLRSTIVEVLPDVEERLQYGKPHYLKNGHYTAVIHAAKDKVSFMLFNAGNIPEIKGFLKSMSSPDRKTVTIIEGQEPEYGLIAELLERAASSL